MYKSVVVRRNRNTFFMSVRCFSSLNTRFLETIVYIWGCEHLSYSE